MSQVCVITSKHMGADECPQEPTEHSKGSERIRVEHTPGPLAAVCALARAEDVTERTQC